MMLGWNTRLPYTLRYNPSLETDESTHEYAIRKAKRLKDAHQLLQDQQTHIQREDEEENLRCALGDLVLLENRRHKKGECVNRQALFCRSICGAGSSLKSYLQNRHY